jgi:hypothetical protein
MSVLRSIHSIFHREGDPSTAYKLEYRDISKPVSTLEFALLQSCLRPADCLSSLLLVGLARV